MIDRLFSLLQKPGLWQRSSDPFWDDEHISKQMLEAHLNPDMEAASRKHSNIDRSVRWLSGVIPAGSRILDLGCGPGLYTKRLSEMGYGVTGMDYSRRSIAYAKGQDTQTEYIDQNYLKLDYTEAFDAVTLIYCDYGALVPDERQELLGRVHRALEPGGRFILDVFTDERFKGKKAAASWTLFQDGGFWSSEPHICLEAKHYFLNNTVEVRQTIIVTECRLYQHLIWDSVFNKQALSDEASPFGFRICGAFDDVCGSPYTGKADTLCVMLEKQGK